MPLRSFFDHATVDEEGAVHAALCIPPTQRPPKPGDPTEVNGIPVTSCTSATSAFQILMLWQLMIKAIDNMISEVPGCYQGMGRRPPRQAPAVHDRAGGRLREACQGTS